MRLKGFFQSGGGQSKHLLVGALSLLGAGPPVEALEIAPEGLVFRLKGGERGMAVMTVFNDGDRAIDVEMGVQNIQNGSSWLSVRPKSFHLGSGERRNVRVRVKAPHARGEKTLDLVAETPITAHSHLRIVRHVRLVLDGTEHHDVAIDGLGVEPGTESPVVVMTCRNAGNVSVRLKLVAEIISEGVASRSPLTDLGPSGVAPGHTVEVRLPVPGAEVPGGSWVRGTAYYRGVDGKTVSVVKTIEARGPKE